MHPYLFSVVYQFTDWLSRYLNLPFLQHADILIAAPKVLQAVFAAIGDFYTWRLSRKIYGLRVQETRVTVSFLPPPSVAGIARGLSWTVRNWR